MSSKNERSAAQKKMESLQAEYEKLRQAKIRAEADRENAEARLAELEAEATQSFGTADPGELSQKLADLEAENEKRTAEYEKHIRELSSAVSKVEAEVRSDREGAVDE